MTKEELQLKINQYFIGLGIQANDAVDVRAVYFTFINNNKKDINPIDIQVEAFTGLLKQYINAKGFDMSTIIAEGKQLIRVIERKVVAPARIELKDLSISDLRALANFVIDDKLAKVNQEITNRINLINF